MATETNYVAPRTCTVVDDGAAKSGVEKVAKSLSKYSEAAAYVLIAEPGAGKTTAFQSEAGRQGGHICHSPELSDLSARGRSLFAEPAYSGSLAMSD